MRILFIHERFGALAGAEANLYVTATELKQRGHEVGLLHGPTTGKNEAAWAKTFSFRRPLGNGNDLQERLRCFAPDIIYVHKLSRLDLIEALVHSGQRLVRMVHDHDIYCMRHYKYHPLTREVCHRPAGPHCVFPCGAFVARNREGFLPLKFISYAAKRREIELNQRFDRMIVVTAYMRDELLQNGFDPARIEIHPPVPRMPSETLSSNFSQRNLILYIGQVIRGKGVDILLQSLALLKTPFECIILGEGSHRRKCEAICRRLRLQDRVQFAGFVPQDQVKEYLRECSVVAISSVWPEPFATVGMEVMRYGIPVVAFDAGGIKDWLHDGENGFLVPWMDRQQYASRIGQLLADKQLARQLGENGRVNVNTNYDFGRYISGLEAMFDRVASREPSIQTARVTATTFAK